MKFEKWLIHEFSTGVYTGEDFKRFLKDMRCDLQGMAEKNDLQLSKFNENHYCFSAVLKDKKSNQYVYVSMSDVRGSHDWSANVLIRNMRYENDWTGETNFFCRWDDVGIKASILIQQKAKMKQHLDIKNDRLR